MTKKKKRFDLPKPLSLAFTIAIFLVIPIPPAVYFGGVDWLTQGPQAGLKEFLITYVLGLVVLLVSLGFTVFRGRKKKSGQATQVVAGE